MKTKVKVPAASMGHDVETATHKRFMKKFLAQWQLHILAFPAVLIIIVFSYIPMYGAQIAFKDFSPALGMWGSPWVGFAHFIRFFKSYYFWATLKNTIIISLSTFVFTFPMPIIFALFLNEIRRKRFKKVMQTVTYAPYFISMTVMVGMVVTFLSPSSGIVNIFMKKLGLESINFMQEPSWFVPIYVISTVWQTTGWSSVLYLAALAGVDVGQYEAARIDGASNWKIMWKINLPSILPTIIINLILSCGSILSVGFEKIYLMQNPLNADVSEVISTYVYKAGLINVQYSFATAVGMFNSVVNLILLLTVNKISGKVSETSLF